MSAPAALTRSRHRGGVRCFQHGAQPVQHRHRPLMAGLGPSVMRSHPCGPPRYPSAAAGWSRTRRCHCWGARSSASDRPELEFGAGMLLGPRNSNEGLQDAWAGCSRPCRRTEKETSASGVESLGESRPRRWRLERVREVLGLVRDEAVTELHDAHRDRRCAVVCDYALAHPHRTGAEHPP